MNLTRSATAKLARPSQVISVSYAPEAAMKAEVTGLDQFDLNRSALVRLRASPLAKNDPPVLSRIDPDDRVVIVRRRRTKSPQLCLAATIRAVAVGL